MDVRGQEGRKINVEVERKLVRPHGIQTPREHVFIMHLPPAEVVSLPVGEPPSLRFHNVTSHYGPKTICIPAIQALNLV